MGGAARRRSRRVPRCAQGDSLRIGDVLLWVMQDAVGTSRSRIGAETELRRAAWDRGPQLSDLEQRQFEFEGGGAASERRPKKPPSRLSRLFRWLIRGA